MLPQGMLELTRSQRATTTPDLHRKCLRSRRSARKDCGGELPTPSVQMVDGIWEVDILL